MIYRGFVIQEDTKEGTWIVGMRWEGGEYIEYDFHFSSLLSAQQMIDTFWEKLPPEWHKVKNKAKVKVKNKAKVKSKVEPTYRRIDIGQEDE